MFESMDTVGLTGIKMELLSLNQLFFFSSLHQTMYVCVCVLVCLITVPVLPHSGRKNCMHVVLCLCVCRYQQRLRLLSGSMEPIEHQAVPILRRVSANLKDL